MDFYKDLYFQMVRAGEQALRALDRQDFGTARSVLISAQQAAEARYLEREGPGTEGFRGASAAACGESAPSFFCLDKRKRPRPVKRKPLWTKGRPPGRPFVMTGAVRIGPPAAPVCRPCAIPLLRRTLSPHNNCAGQRGVCRIDQLLFPLPLTRRSSKAGAAAAVRGAGQIADHPPFIRRTVYAAPGFFDRRGKAQGRRGCRHPPHRFARPPHTRRGRPMGPPVGAGHILFLKGHAEKKLAGGKFLAQPRPNLFRPGGTTLVLKMGGAIPREPPGPRRPAAPAKKDRPLRDGPARMKDRRLSSKTPRCR